DDDGIETTPIAGSKVKDKQNAIVEQWEEDEGQRWSGPFPPADLATDNIAWVASDNKYFAVVLVPLPAKSGKRQKHVTAIVADTYTDVTPMGKTPVGQSHLISQKISFPKGVAEVRRSFLLFAGPKEEELLEKQYADYNFPALIVWARSCCFCAIPGIHYISKFMVWAINSFTLLTFNYGLSIILLVIIIRVVMHPITRWTQKSARKMQKLAPLMQELKERCGDDKKRLQQEQMLLYKEHGVNPMGMILPMFVQMPIWFGLYGGLMVAISLRQAPFFWWIQDLSQPDALITFSQPFFLPGADIPLLGYLVNMINGMLGGGITSLNILPLFVVIGMYLQQLVMPRTTTGPQAAQQKHMMIFMTIFLGLVLYSAPAGLNLYICTSTTLGFIEQRLIRRHLNRLDSEPSTAPPPGPPPGKKQDLGSGRYRSPAERIEAWLAKRVGAKKAAPKPPGEKKKRKK
ncbi:MAG: membrane protein insertase YidC, partial [Planctomycetia bacterium]|nr:membrane protein insertase YidC [Planctomycetia bacterium]